MAEDFLEFHDALTDLVKAFEERNILLKVQSDLDSNIVKIYGERSDALARANAGLEEIFELAFATAEHHPYWNLLYNTSQILKMTLEKWNTSFTKEELDEIRWCADEIKNSLEKISDNHHDK